MKQIEFAAPKGYVSPEGKNEFQELCTIRRKPNGRMCLVAVSDFKLPGYEQKSAQPPTDVAKEAGMNTAARYSQKMTGMEGGAY